MSDYSSVPLSLVVNLDDLRGDIKGVLGNALDTLSFIDGHASGDVTDRVGSFILKCEEEFILQLPLLNFLSFKIGGGLIFLDYSFNTTPTYMVGNEDSDGITLEPEGFTARLKVDVLSIQVDNSILKPVHLNSQGVYEPSADPNEKVEFPLSVIFSVDDDLNLDVIMPFDSGSSFSLPPCQIGNTGLIASFQNIKVDLSTTSNIPEAASLPMSFRGVYVGEAEIMLPPKWFTNTTGAQGPKIVGRNLFIGSGGFSGTLALEAGTGSSVLQYNFVNGILIELDAFSITFDEGAVTDSAITGTITFPGFGPVAITVDISDTGFTITIDPGSNSGINIDRSLLVPMKLVNGNYEVETDTSKKVKFLIDTGSVTYTNVTDDLTIDVDLILNPAYPRAQIGSIPVSIGGATHAHLHYTTSGAQQIAIDQLDVLLPKSFSQANGGSNGPYIKATNIIIDTVNGFSGTLALQAGTNPSNPDNALLKYNFVNDLEIALDAFSITFLNNAVTASAVTGHLRIPGVTTPIGLTVTFSGSGISIGLASGSGAQLKISRSLLLPLDAAGQDAPASVQTTFLITGGTISYNSGTGAVGFAINLSMDPAYPKAKIGSTPLIISFSGLHLDFTNTSRQVKIDSVTVALPSDFNPTNSVQITGTNIVIDSSNGFSGSLAASGNLTYNLKGLALTLTSFGVTFTNGSVTSSSISGTLTLTTPPYTFGITVDIQNGFVLTVNTVNGVTILNNSNLSIIVNELILGKHGSVWELGLAAELEIKRQLPVIKDLFPKKIKIKHPTLFKTDGSSPQYNFEIQWANGTVISGDQNTGIAVTFPVNIKIGDVFHVDGLQLIIKTDPVTSSTRFEVLMQGAGLELGPVSGSVDALGAVLTIKSDASGNLGPFKTELDFIGPKGIGLAIDNPVLSGGGFLYIGDHEYMGAISLSFKNKISINAIGILTTQLPGGEAGYSLLVIISVEFTPIQLGMGFTLNGIGGLLGLHRTMNTDKLRAGVKDGTIDNVLFPKDIIKNALPILSNISQVFPAKKNRFLIGPMAKIGWGTPTLLTIELGVIIELPSPVLLAIVGVLRAVLPTEAAPVLRIQINFVGIIDFEKKQLSFDASLYDSSILTFALTGDMALRLFWGDKPNFLLSVGGFHPKFTPPPMNLPQLQRLAIQLAQSNNLNIRVETYFAVTSNSVQFGARVAARARAWKIEAVGALWFDILFQFSPFHFIADMGVMFEIRKGGDVLLSLYIDVTLEGPHPWRVQGEGSFKILFVKVHVSFDKTFGQAQTETTAPVAIQSLMHDAIQKKDNWQVIGPDRSHQVVAFRDISAATAGALVVDPFGALVFSQKVAPMGIRLVKFGTSAISDVNKFEITGVTAGSGSSAVTLPSQHITDFFAPNSFFYLSDDQKLSKESYEKYDSGVSVGTTSEITTDYYVHKEIAYDEIILDSRQRQRFRIFALTANEMALHTMETYVSTSAISDTKKKTPFGGPDKLMMQDFDYIIADKNTLSPVSGVQSFSSKTDADNYLLSLVGTPAFTDRMVIHAFELY